MMSILIDGFDRCVFSMLLIMLWFGRMLEQNDYILPDIYVYIMHIRLYSVFLYSILYFFCIDFGSSCGAISSYRCRLCCSVPWCPLLL